METLKFTIENGKLRTEQSMLINFGRIENLCGYIMEIVYYDTVPFASYSLFNDSHFSGGINQTNTPVSELSDDLKIYANAIIRQIKFDRLHQIINIKGTFVYTYFNPKRIKKNDQKIPYMINRIAKKCSYSGNGYKALHIFTNRFKN